MRGGKIIDRPISLATFFTPNLLNNASFETDWNGFLDYGSGPPSNGVIRSTAFAYAGIYSAEFAWTANNPTDGGCQMEYNFGAYDRIWLRFYFRVTNKITTTWKWARFGDQSDLNFGGLWFEKDGGGTSGNGMIDWGWDASENSAIITTIGLTEAQVVDSAWHSIEYEYWRNGDPSGWPSAAFWFDGNPQYAELNGHSTVKYYGAGNVSYWDAAGRLQAGERGSSTLKPRFLRFMGTLNQDNTTSGQCNIDRVAISTLGRIGL